MWNIFIFILTILDSERRWASKLIRKEVEESEPNFE